MRDAVIRDILVILRGFTTCLGRVKASHQARRSKRPDTRDPGRVSILQMTDSKLRVREFAFLEDQIPWFGFLIFSQCQLEMKPDRLPLDAVEVLALHLVADIRLLIFIPQLSPLTFPAGIPFCRTRSFYGHSNAINLDSMAGRNA